MDTRRNTKKKSPLEIVISCRKEQKVTQQKVAKIMGCTKQRWSKIEKDYESKGIESVQFTSQQMMQLNQILAIPIDDALYAANDAMIFDESAIIEKAFEDAKKRDYQLTLNALQCIYEVEEKDVKLLYHTLDFLCVRPAPYDYSPSKMLVSAARNSVTQSILKLIPDENALREIVHRYELQTETAERPHDELCKLMTEFIVKQVDASLSDCIRTFLSAKLLEK